MLMRSSISQLYIVRHQVSLGLIDDQMAWHTVAFRHVAVAVRSAAAQVLTGPRPLQLAAAEPLAEQRSLVLGDGTLDLQQELVARVLADRPMDEVAPGSRRAGTPRAAVPDRRICAPGDRAEHHDGHDRHPGRHRASDRALAGRVARRCSPRRGRRARVQPRGHASRPMPATRRAGSRWSAHVPGARSTRACRSRPASCNSSTGEAPSSALADPTSNNSRYAARTRSGPSRTRTTTECTLHSCAWRVRAALAMLVVSPSRPSMPGRPDVMETWHQNGGE